MLLKKSLDLSIFFSQKKIVLNNFKFLKSSQIENKIAKSEFKVKLQIDLWGWENSFDYCKGNCAFFNLRMLHCFHNVSQPPVFFLFLWEEATLFIIIQRWLERSLGESKLCSLYFLKNYSLSMVKHVIP